jgi:thiamine transport system permease protein
MASRPRALTGPAWGAALVAALLVALTLGTATAVALRAGSLMPGPSDWAALRFTVTQAALSALVSTLLAIPVARALARRRFPGRTLLITLMGAPFLLPVIVAVLGLAGHLWPRRRPERRLASAWACPACRSTGCTAWCWRMSS